MIEANGAAIDAEDDYALVVRVRAGDRSAYAVLARRHAPIALRTASLLGAGSEAEDVVQEAMIKAYRTLDRFREGAPFRPWLLRIVANETHNLNRASIRRVGRERSAVALSPDLIAPDAVDDPEGHALRAESRAALLRALQDLPEPMRQVVTCRYLLDLDEAETATVLNLPRGTVKSRLNRGLTKLRSLIADEMPTAVGGAHD